MGARDTLSTAIKNKLITLDTYFDSAVVYDYPNLNTQTPAACIIPSGVEPNFDTQQSNKRIYGFTILLIEELGEDGVNAAYTKMRALEDAVIDLVDNDYSLGLSDTDFSATLSLIDTLAAPSFWGRTQNDDQTNLLIAEVEVRVFMNKDIL